MNLPIALERKKHGKDTATMGSKYVHVFAPAEIRGVKYKNRIGMAPTSPKFTDPMGFITTEHIEYFRPIARGGVGAITLGNCTVDIVNFQDEPRQVALDNDHYIPGLARMVDMFEQYGVVGQCEINHAGLDSSWDLNHVPGLGPSAQMMPNELMRAAAKGRPAVPAEAMSTAQIKQVQQQYIDAAFRCKRAGMRSCFLHAGHTNLIGQFSSPLYNHRRDEYGGSLENRARFCMEILSGIREKCGEDFVIEMRISADEMHPDGMHFEETKQYLQMMDGMFDIVNVSAGMHTDINYFKYWSPHMFMGKMVNVGYAAELKKILRSKVSAVAGIANLDDAEKILSEGWADFVLMARGLMADPEMPRKYAFNRAEEVRPCIRCNFCGRRVRETKTVACAVNPKLGRELELDHGEVPLARNRKKVLVVGAGPGGMQAAMTAIERGHEVIVCEKSDSVGGNLVTAAAMHLKTDLPRFRDWFIRRFHACGAEIRTNTEVTPELVAQIAPDAMVIAAGAAPVMLPVPGAELPHVHWCGDADMGRCEVGDAVAVIGGGSVGLEGAAALAAKGKRVTVLEMNPKLPRGVVRADAELCGIIENAGGSVKTGRKLLAIYEDHVVCENVESGETEKIACDTVLMACGLQRRSDTVEALCRCIPETEVYIIGDCRAPRMIGDAIREGFDAALSI